jgi:hypothetical protein
MENGISNKRKFKERQRKAKQRANQTPDKIQERKAVDYLFSCWEISHLLKDILLKVDVWLMFQSLRKFMNGWGKTIQNFAIFKEFHECPCPILVEDDSSMDEESGNSTVERKTDIEYWFPSNGDPTSSNSVFNSQPEFIDSLLKNKEPTLIFRSSNYQPDYKLTLPLLFPLHFLFGVGGLDEERRTHVSTEECLKHYLKILKISLTQLLQTQSLILNQNLLTLY